MSRRAIPLLLVTLVLAAGLLGGCARAKRDTAGFALNNSATISAGFEDTWQATKHVLREGGYDLYTRDKRGTFIAYTKEKRRLLQPQRIKYTINLTAVAEKETQVEIEAVKQIYGVTLLTNPDWHDRKLPEDPNVQAILDALQAKAAAGPAEAAPAGEMVEAAPAQ